MQNVVNPWAGVAQGRSEDTAAVGTACGTGLGIDRGCQSKEECGSGEGVEEHLNNECVKVRRMAGGAARDRLLEHENECDDEFWKRPWLSFYTRAERHNDNVRLNRTKKISST
jgi:hypothetical protein